MWSLPRLDTHHASVSHDLLPCPPLKWVYEESLGDLTPIPRSFSGTPTSRQRHRGMRGFFAPAASPCFARRAWHLLCVCVPLTSLAGPALCWIAFLYLDLSTPLLSLSLSQWISSTWWSESILSPLFTCLVVFLPFVIWFLYNWSRLFAYLAHLCSPYIYLTLIIS